MASGLAEDLCETPRQQFSLSSLPVVATHTGASGPSRDLPQAPRRCATFLGSLKQIYSSLALPPTHT